MVTAQGPLSFCEGDKALLFTMGQILGVRRGEDGDVERGHGSANSGRKETGREAERATGTRAGQG